MFEQEQEEHLVEESLRRLEFARVGKFPDQIDLRPVSAFNDHRRRALKIDACFLIERLYGVRYTDLGPFRAIRWRTLESLDMRDTDFGWTLMIPSTSAACSYRPAAASKAILMIAV